MAKIKKGSNHMKITPVVLLCSASLETDRFLWAKDYVKHKPIKSPEQM